MNKSKTGKESPGILRSESSLPEKLLLLTLAASCLLLSSKVLDTTLIPRFIILSIGLFLFFILYSKTVLKHLRIDLIVIAFSGYILSHFISCIWAYNPPEAFYESLKVLLGGLVFYATSKNLSSYEEFEEKIENLVCYIALTYSIIALIQLAKLNTFDIQSLYHINGLTGHKNLLSTFLFISLPFSLNAYRNTINWRRYLCASSLILSFILIGILQTRSVLLAAQLSVILMFILYIYIHRKTFNQTLKKSLITSGGIVVSLVLFFYVINITGVGNILERVDITTYAQSTTGKERLAIWSKTVQLIKEYFPTGVGAGNWQFFYSKYNLDGIPTAIYDNQTFQRPHNDFLWVMSETGLAGITFYLVLLFIPLVLTIKMLLIKKATQLSLKILPYLGALLGFIVISIFDFPKERIELLVIINITLAVLYNQLIKENSLPAFSTIPLNTTVTRAVCLICLAAALFTGGLRFKGESAMQHLYATKNSGNWNSVIQYADKANSILYKVDPTTIPISWYKGLAYFSVNNFNAALKEYEAAYTLSPYNYYIINDLASSCEMLGRHEQAKKYYLEALRINRHFDDAKLNMAAIFFNEKKYETAWQYTQGVSDKNLRKAQFVSTIKPYIKSN